MSCPVSRLLTSKKKKKKTITKKSGSFPALPPTAKQTPGRTDSVRAWVVAMELFLHGVRAPGTVREVGEGDGRAALGDGLLGECRDRHPGCAVVERAERSALYTANQV